MTPQKLIEKIAETATGIGFQAGVGATETAGSIVSGLAAHPELIEPFMTDPLGTYHDRYDAFVPGSGVLTWHAVNGEIVSPAQLREHVGKRDH